MSCFKHEHTYSVFCLSVRLPLQRHGNPHTLSVVPEFFHCYLQVTRVWTENILLCPAASLWPAKGQNHISLFLTQIITFLKTNLTPPHYQTLIRRMTKTPLPPVWRVVQTERTAGTGLNVSSS